MKTFFSILIVLLVLTNHSQAQEKPEVLLGKWKIDMSPEDPSDSNFAMMVISSVGKNSIEGTFYREGVKIREGRLQVSGGIIYGALVSGDNSGTYNTSFHHKEGVLYGTTHSIDKDFLAVWKATKSSE